MEKKRIKEIDKIYGINERKQIDSQIKTEGIYSTNKIRFTPGQKQTTDDQVMEHYYELLSDRSVRKDQELMDDILKYKQSILQHRIYCQITLKDKDGILATCQITEVLLEHGQEITNYWHGKEIDPTDWLGYLIDFQNTMKTYGCKEVMNEMTPTRRSTVIDVELNFTFA